MDLEELKNKQIEQMTKKNCLPKDDTEIILHLVEEIGEVCEAVRENQSKEEFEDEIADILWQLNKLCWIHKINLEEIFIKKLEKNEKR
ncbi:MAG: MazG nucleotide pyrophosphohydrolase domain-containing protein [Candidatus Woesearchaeota archaeon]